MRLSVAVEVAALASAGATRASHRAEATAATATPPTMAMEAGGRPFYNNNRGRRNSSGKPRAGPDVTRCQFCGKPGHTARDCWCRFEEDEESSQDEKVAAAADGSYGLDTNWYVDSGATNHITGELEKVTVREKYHGQDQVHAANGEGMRISHIGNSVFKTPHKKIHLRRILHIPSASKNLLSVHRIALDNNVFLEFHPFFFLIKDQVTKKILYRGRCVRGLYPLIPELRRLNKQALPCVYECFYQTSPTHFF